MYTNGNETDVAFRNGYALIDARGLGTSGHPFHGLTSISRDIAASAHQLPDAELMRIAGSLRTLADEVMAVVDRRCGARPAPRLVVDNTRR
jgi:hypothetical protein